MDFLLLALAFFQTSPIPVAETPAYLEQVLVDARAEYPEVEFELHLESPLVVASADVRGGRKFVRLDGGLLRSPRLNADILRFVICHELGHLYGGAPRRQLPPEWTGDRAPDGLSLLSGEGQSDYYAASACFHLLAHANETETGFLSPAEESELDRRCVNARDLVLCRRNARAGLGLLTLVKEFPISFLTPSPERVKVTNADTYPSRQCRLDTILAGALCRMPLGKRGDPLDPRHGACGDPEAERPLCWFAPR
ncbi:MAG: hypothetical protein KF767_17450 [Bdellovibrionaceae bacterium]|nr:hypothetical protein [Pseudobdellovibrionaceae bacterium]